MKKVLLLPIISMIMLINACVDEDSKVSLSSQELDLECKKLSSLDGEVYRAFIGKYIPKHSWMGTIASDDSGIWDYQITLKSGRAINTISNSYTISNDGRNAKLDGAIARVFGDAGFPNSLTALPTKYNVGICARERSNDGRLFGKIETFIRINGK